jgi:hypothetical protein
MQQGDNARILFSIGSKIFESDKMARNVRQVFDNSDFDISSMDYEFSSKIFYFVDSKKNKVNYWFENLRLNY